MALVAIQTAIPCFVCHGRNFTDNAEYFMRLFDTDTDDGETKTSQLLSSILGRPLTQETVHSPLLCRTCAQLCDEYEMMLNRLESIRVSIIESYNETIDAYCQAAEEQQKQLEREQEQQQLASKEEPLSAYVTSVAATDQPAQFVINHADNNIIVEVNVNGLIGVDNVTTAMPAYTIHDQGIVLPSITSTIDISGQPTADPTGPIDSSYVHDEFDSGKLDTADYSELMQTASATAPLQSNLFDVHSMRPIFLRDGQSFLCQLCGDADVTDPDKPPAIYSSETICSHLRTEHDERVYICHMCGCDYRQRDELVDHLRTHVAEGAGDDDDDYSADNQIDYCDEDNDAIDDNAADSNLPSSTDVHQRPVIETSSESLTCPVCAHSSPTVHQMRQHKRQHHASAQKLFACQCCAKRFKSSNMLREHANTHTGERPYKCTDCPKDFASKYTLTSHRKIHTDRKRPFACAECPKRFYSLQNLLQHGRTHSGVRQHECIECGKTFGSAHNLYVHRVVHTGERPFKCHDCGKAFARRAEFRDHERTHTGERPYGCDVCGATFAQRSNLMSHKRATHLNDKRYKCAACEKSFKRKRLLDYHVKVSHTGERPLECGTCAATFVYPEHFKKHMRIHSGLKPFACEVCGKAFSSRDNRNAHRFVHSDKKPYECLCCGQGFMRKPLLLAHMKVRQHESKKIVVNRPRIMKSAPNAGGAGGRGAESEEGEHDGVADYEESGAEVVELDDAELDEYVIEAEEEDGEEEEDEDEEDVDDDLESTAALSNVVIMNDGGVVEFDDIIFEDPLDETVFE